MWRRFWTRCSRRPSWWRGCPVKRALAVRGRVDEDDVIIAAGHGGLPGGEVLGKPADEMDAFKMLSALSGNRHQVYTGLTVIRGEQVVTEHEMTTVTFRDLDPEEIEHYIATGEPMDQGRRLRNPGNRRAAGVGHRRGLFQRDGPAGVPAGPNPGSVRRGRAGAGCRR